MDLLFWIGPLVAMLIGGGLVLYFILPDLHADLTGSAKDED